MPPTERAKRLGYFSLALGTAQLVMPRTVARLVGARDGQLTMRLLGAREIAAGIGLLRQRRPAIWLWSRVGGDALDLGLLALAMTDRHNDRRRTVASTVAVAGVTALDLSTALQQRESSEDSDEDGSVHLSTAITVRKPTEAVYAFWRNFRNLPSFMTHLDSVAVLDEHRSHWTARGPAGRSVEWDAELLDDRPNELIAWRSLPGAQVVNSGRVRFSAAPAGRGTEVRVEMDYRPPAGRLGAAIAWLMGEEPRLQVQADLRKFKQVLETGAVIRSEATVMGAHILQGPAQHPAAAEPTGVRS